MVNKGIEVTETSIAYKSVVRVLHAAIFLSLNNNKCVSSFDIINYCNSTKNPILIPTLDIENILEGSYQLGNVKKTIYPNGIITYNYMTFLNDLKKGFLNDGTILYCETEDKLTNWLHLIRSKIEY